MAGRQFIANASSDSDDPSTQVPNVWSDFSSVGYRAAVEQIVESIHAGDCFQVNLSQKLVTPATSHPAA